MITITVTVNVAEGTDPKKISAMVVREISQYFPYGFKAVAVDKTQDSEQHYVDVLQSMSGEIRQ